MVHDFRGAHHALSNQHYCVNGLTDANIQNTMVSAAKALPDAAHIEMSYLHNLGKAIDTRCMSRVQLLLGNGAQGLHKLHNGLTIQLVTVHHTSMVSNSYVQDPECEIACSQVSHLVT